MVTAVLVHGGSVTSTAWDPLLPHLGAEALAVDLPGRRHKPADLGTVLRGDWERSVAEDVRAAGLDDVVLVGHSSGGYVIPGVARLLGPEVVRHLVYVCATLPVEGASPAESMTAKLQEIARGNEANLRAGARGKTLGGLRPDEPPVETDLEVVGVGGRMGLEAPGQLFEAMTWAGVPDLPCTYVRALGDRVIPPEHALVMAANGGVGEIVDLEGEHDLAGTAPAELAAVIDGIVDRYR